MKSAWRVFLVATLLMGCGGASSTGGTTGGGARAPGRDMTPEVVAADARMMGGGCLSPDESTFVLPLQNGDLVAFNTADGTPRWRLPAATRSAAACDVLGVVLVGIGDGLHVTLRDYATGEALAEHLVPVEGCSHGDLYVAPWPKDGAWGFAWQALAYWSGGYPPSPQEEEAAHCENSGTVFVDRASDDVTASSGATLNTPTPSTQIMLRDGRTLVMEVHTLDVCSGTTQDPPPRSALSVRRGDELVWDFTLVSPHNGDSCIP